MRIASLCSLAIGLCSVSFAATYTWNVASGGFNTAGSWTPSRTPATADVLIFNGSTQANPTVTNWGSGVDYTQMILQNNVTVHAQSGGAVTRTMLGTGVLGSGNEPLIINAGSTLIFEGANTIGMFIAAGNTGQCNILGDIVYANSGSCRLEARVANSIVFRNGSRMFVCPTGNVAIGPFNNAVGNTVSGGIHFESGSKLIWGANQAGVRSVGTYQEPFKLTAPQQMATFDAGSEIVYYKAANINVGNRAVANLKFQCDTAVTGLAIPSTVNNIVVANNGTGTQFDVQFVGTTAFSIANNLTIDATSGGFSDAPTAARTLSVGGTVAVNNALNLGNNSTLSIAGALTVAGGGTLNASPNAIGGAGSVTVNAAGNLNIKHAGGVDGQIPGTKSLNTAGNYGYTGSAAQVTGAALPANVNKLTINNAAGVSLSSAVNADSELALTAGTLSTGANALTVGTSPAATGTVTGAGGIQGTLKRWIAAAAQSYSFPIVNGANSRSATINYTGAPSTGGSLTATFTASNPGELGLPLVDGVTLANVAQDGFWTVSAADGLVDGTYNASLNAAAFSNLGDVNNLRIVKRLTAGPGAWTLDGTAGTNGGTLIARTGLSGFSDFGIAGPIGQVPVSLSAFSLE